VPVPEPALASTSSVKDGEIVVSMRPQAPSSRHSSGSAPPERTRSFLQHGFGSLGQMTRPVAAREGLHAPRFCAASIALNVVMMLVAFDANEWRVEALSNNPSIGVSAETLVRLGAKHTGRIIWRSEWWRLLTASWLHGGLVHLLLNVTLIWQLGSPLERAYGSRAIALTYLLSGLCGVAASALLLPAVVSVGASASCFGLVGAFWGELCTNYVAAHGSLEGARIGTLAAFTATSLVTGVSPVVDNFMHGVGFVTGLLLALVIQPRPRATAAPATFVGAVPPPPGPPPAAPPPPGRPPAPPPGASQGSAMHAGSWQDVASAADVSLSREWCGSSRRALHPRQRSLREASLLLLLVEGCLVLTAFAELADPHQTPDARAGCSWCRALNCAPISWWDCSVFETSLAEVYASMQPSPTLPPSAPPYPPSSPPSPPSEPADDR